MIHVDTHVVVWLYAEQLTRFPSRARARLSVEELVASPMVELELTYLNEVGRLTDPAATVLDTLSHAVGLRLSTAPFPAVVHAARDLTWTRDPFDRLIVAAAVSDGAELLTADETLLAHVPGAFWG